MQSSSIGAIVALGALLFTILLLWVAVANAIYVANFGYAEPESISHFARQVLTTPEGWNLIRIDARA